MSERIPTDVLVERARALLADDPIPHGPGWAAFERIAWSELLTALADRLEELTKVQDPCPECGENVIPLQRGSTRWSCKNHHLQVREAALAEQVRGRG